MARVYARVAGALLLALGVAGLFAGGRPLLGGLNTDPAENVVHLVAGAMLVFVGFSQRDGMIVGIVVLALSSALVLMGVVGFVYPTLFGLFPGGLGVADDLLHLGLGAAGIASVELSRSAGRGKGGPP